MSRLTLVPLAAIALAALPLAAQAAVAPGGVTITACYYSTECTYTADVIRPGSRPAADAIDTDDDHDREHPAGGISGIVDGPAFQFTNTAKIPITEAYFIIEPNKTLGIAKDYFKIGTIKHGTSFVLIPGASNDGRTRSDSSLFFYYFGATSPRDTSDVGPDSNDIVFEFKGYYGKTAVTSGKIKVSATLQPSADGTVASLNFLGGPGNADGPCNDCIKPTVISIVAQPAAVKPGGALSQGLSH